MSLLLCKYACVCTYVFVDDHDDHIQGMLMVHG